jgi:hypothetical protein
MHNIVAGNNVHHCPQGWLYSRNAESMAHTTAVGRCVFTGFLRGHFLFSSPKLFFGAKKNDACRLERHRSLRIFYRERFFCILCRDKIEAQEKKKTCVTLIVIGMVVIGRYTALFTFSRIFPYKWGGGQQFTMGLKPICSCFRILFNFFWMPWKWFLSRCVNF